MMKFCVLASGSKGNVTYVASKNTRLLIDLGSSCAYVEKKLYDIQVEPSSIRHIVITHTHVDHTSGLRVFVKKYNPTVYLTRKMYEDIRELVPLQNCIFIDGDFSLLDINVHIIKTSHDVSDSNGYIFEQDGKSIVYVTDTGYIHIKNHKKLSNHSAYIMESNHDIELLMKGKYPYHLKQRIISDRGHLSNKDSSYYLSHFIGVNTQYIILAHLSEDNNTEDLAKQTLLHTLSHQGKSVEHLIVATQKERTELLEL